MLMLHMQRHRIAKYNLSRCTGLSAATGTYTLMHFNLTNHVSLSLFYADLLQTCLVVQGSTLFSTRLGRLSLTYCTCTHTCYLDHI